MCFHASRSWMGNLLRATVHFIGFRHVTRQRPQRPLASDMSWTCSPNSHFSLGVFSVWAIQWISIFMGNLVDKPCLSLGLLDSKFQPRTSAVFWREDPCPVVAAAVDLTLSLHGTNAVLSSIGLLECMPFAAIPVHVDGSQF